MMVLTLGMSHGIDMRIIIPIGANVYLLGTDGIYGIVTQAIIGNIGTDYNVGYWIENEYFEEIFNEVQIGYESEKYLSVIEKD